MRRIMRIARYLLARWPMAFRMAKRVRNSWFKRVEFNRFFRQAQNDIKGIRRELLDVPNWASIEITNACNLNCTMCGTRSSHRSIGFMSEDLFEQIISELKKIGIAVVGLHTVGEPFMHKGLASLLEIAERHGVKVWLSTNGQFPEKVRSLCKQFSSTITCLRFSIDGATRETYEGIRRGASFERLIESLEVARALGRDAAHSTIDLRINVTVSMTNIFELPLFFSVYSPYCPPSQINFGLLNSLSMNKDYFYEVFPWRHLVHSTIPCGMPFRSVYFTYDGDVTLCCRDYEAELVVGTIREQRLLEIWKGPKAEHIRDVHRGKMPNDIALCASCFSPYGFVSKAINKHIHSLYAQYPHLSGPEFGRKVISILDQMDAALHTSNMVALKHTLRECLCQP